MDLLVQRTWLHLSVLLWKKLLCGCIKLLTNPIPPLTRKKDVIDVVQHSIEADNQGIVPLQFYAGKTEQMALWFKGEKRQPLNFAVQGFESQSS